MYLFLSVLFTLPSIGRTPPIYNPNTRWSDVCRGYRLWTRTLDRLPTQELASLKSVVSRMSATTRVNAGQNTKDTQSVP